MAGFQAAMGEEGMDDGYIAVQADAGNEEGAAVKIAEEEETVQFAESKAKCPGLGWEVIKCQWQQREGVEQVANGQVEGVDDSTVPGVFMSPKAIDGKDIPNHS